ncbi:MAG TPA: metal-dependent transcriptional regulator [Gemmatimonadales bacterium]
MNAAAQQQPLTRSVEDYLKAIYHLSLDGQPASTSAIAQSLDLAPPSVSGMIRRLSELGLLEHVPYRGVALTDEGRRAALRMVRRHRIIEAYLVALLGYTWDSVHEEAERLEHAVSESLIERMAEALGNPQFDPHGDPIPDAQGHVEEPRYVPLSEVAEGETAEIHRVDTSHAERLRYLSDMGLTPGTAIRVMARQPFDGPLTIERGGRSQIIGHELARLLLCLRPSTRA